MVHYLKFDARKGTHVDPDYAGGGSYPAIDLLRVTDVLMVMCDSADADRVYVYYNAYNGRVVSATQDPLDKLQYVTVYLDAAQTDYNFANWLRDQIRSAIEMTTAGPAIMDVTSIPPVLPNDIAQG